MFRLRSRSGSSLEQAEARELTRLVTRPDLPASFERWQLTLAPGMRQPTHEWAGALVLIEDGQLEVDCLAGGRRTFTAGDLLVLGWLPVRQLVNRSARPARLVAVRRRGEHVPAGLFRVIRHLRR